MQTPSTPTHPADMLTTALAEQLPALLGSPIQLGELRQLAGGASKAIWRLDCTIAEGPQRGQHRLVLTRQLGGKIKADALDLPAEFSALSAAYAAGVPTPRPFLLLPDLLGRPAALVEWLAGESIGRRIVREPALEHARTQLPQQLGSALAAIHQVQPDQRLLATLPGPLPGQTVVQSAIAQIEADLDRIGEPHPAIELCLRWLRRNEPPPTALSFVHGDFRLGNLMVQPSGLVGVLDWEFAHLGDPHEDLVWPLLRDWRFGNDPLHFAGISQPEPFFAAYAAAGGFAPTPQSVHYWEVLGNIRWAIGCLNQAERHLSGQEPNLEFASLGRRCAEMELEALRLIRPA